MKLILSILLFFLSAHLLAQNILVVEKPGTVKNIIYYAGENISLLTIDGEKINGPINIIKDSTNIVDFVHELELSEIQAVYKPRYLIDIFGTAFIGGSLLYVTLDAVNGGLNNKNLIKNSGFMVSMGFLATGITMKLFSKKKMPIDGKKWRIKILED